MRLYADLPRRGLRQAAGDVLVLLWVAVWGWAGRLVHRLVSMLAEPGRIMERSGEGLADTMARIAERVRELPLVGGALEEPFRAASGAGRSLAEAGIAQQQVVADLALILGLTVALVPILLALVLYLPGRVRWMREAAAARRLGGDEAGLQLLALRAVGRRSLPELRRALGPGGGSLTPADYRALAALELEELGVETERG